MVLIEALLGWLLADLLTGAYHWVQDNCFSETTPVIGQWLIAPGRLHHSDPLAFTHHGFWARNLASIVTAIILVGPFMLIAPSVFLLTLMVGGALANEIHFYAHRPSLAPAPVRLAQRLGLMQSAKSHALHHRPPHNANYCVMTDWLNPLFGAVR